MGWLVCIYALGVSVNVNIRSLVVQYIKSAASATILHNYGTMVSGYPTSSDNWSLPVQTAMSAFPGSVLLGPA